MERTRHFVATVYVVNDGATALHHHDQLDMWLPPGGHIERDELPHDAARREVREEIGQDVDLLADRPAVASETMRPIPRPQQFLLEDIDVCDGEVGHQHIDFVFYGGVPSRTIDPEPGEQPPEDWEWFSPADLRNGNERFEPDVVEFGQRAIDRVGTNDQ